MQKKLPSSKVSKIGWTWQEEITKTTCIYKGDLPRVSIVTPSFNQGEFIEQTIRSVLLQNYPNIQYIVIDGGSTDNTVQILEKYSPWLDYWVSEPDRGQSHAINKGLKLCDGEWFNWVNSDDYLMPGAISAMMEQVRQDEDLSIITGTTENIRDNISFGKYSATFRDNSDIPFFSLGINQPGSLIKLADIKKCNGVREDLNLCMDLELWLHILLNNGQKCLKVIPDIVAAYRYHNQSKTCSNQDVFALEEFCILTDIYESLSVDQTPKPLKYLRDQCNAGKHQYFPKKMYDQIDIAKNYFDRLLVNDSLLFRAILKSNKLQSCPFRYFENILEEIEEDIRIIYGESFQTIKANAWLRAMQNKGEIYKTGVTSTLKNLSLIPTIRELARIIIKGNK